MVKENGTTFNTDNRHTNVNRNMFVAGFSVVIPALLVFISRKVFLDALNLQYLGLNETFTSLLGSLTLTELGFQAAILYNLYKPIHDNDTDKVNRLISILRVIFNYIGTLFVIVPFVMLPFIGYLLKGVELTDAIRAYFLLIAFSSAVSYFFSYPKCLLQADQKEYVIKITDIIVQVIFVVLQIIVLLSWRSFLLFLILNIARNLCSNLIIHIYCRRKYQFLHKVPFDRVLFKEIWSNAKNIFVGRVAGVVYGAIDNILISAFISTATVGGFANYATIAKVIKTACYRLFPIGSVIGNMFADDTIEAKHYELIFRVYTIAKALLAYMILIPLLLLFNPFIRLWLGEQYLFSEAIVFLIVFDMYVFFLTNPVGDFVFAKGLFRLDKKIALVGLLVNVALSLLLIQYIGVPGVLLGTAFSQLVIWTGRCHILYRHAFESKALLHRYVRTQILFGIVFVAFYIGLDAIISYLHLLYTSYVDLIGVALVVEVIVVITALLAYCQLEEFKYIVSKFRKIRS